ncbi:hypothetical protein COY52_01680 [Candidatus Desantisbacteria bacterium CG_4_10_14_0_8_um_filter_48_22]|uniref:histidine kinase n=1 Tax=Candidatus Desantisbacteria bacterium CG_4_10_14_0_8_um_filter_48_22 TaxID=1974543 RepID=A0A2M7SFD4_9BACT|nr:MAG: hypothetical protein COS16_06670 [Candidatus Desantisbacteria bacterium CG02_land_8_20_14_3_00_49_13]PIZ18003.1 MAG: hypothetical protein COY52_01680 [Candidatus Desantisbacteria bacterium CG_4_10_14_0_8_um_filter_48_22]
MRQRENSLKCWEYFICNKAECPAYHSEDLRCWLQCGTHCHNEITGTWLEKIEACFKCEVFKRNFHTADSIGTLALAGSQFESYKNKVIEKTKVLKEAEKRLTDFKLTSVYLLKELDKRSRELLEAKDKLERKVEERTRELQDIQEHLIQSAKLSSLGEFAAGIAHEINNPLAGMFNCIRTLLQNRDITGKEREYLCLVENGLSRIEGTVKQILTFSGTQLGKFKEIDINSTIEESLHFMEYKMKEQGITLKKTFSGSSLIIYGDENQLHQVFMNIISNAIDAVPHGNGFLEVESKMIIGDNKEWAQVYFVDNGCGINEKDISRVFDPFYTTKEVGKGIGLGLSISHRIIQYHNGVIKIKSQKGEGTTVEILLPVSSQSIGGGEI